MEDYFCKISNEMIRSKSFDAKEVCVRFILNEIRGMSDKCHFSLRYLIDSCGYTPRRGKDGVNGNYKNILRKLEQDNLIVVDEKYGISDSSVCHINDLIVLKINPDRFDVVENFTKLTNNEFDCLIRNSQHHNKGALLHLYLYIKSYYHKLTSFNRPLGCHQSLKTIGKNIGLSEKTLISLLSSLVDSNLLIKYYVGAMEVKKYGDKSRINVPNIYIPNLGQSQDEINETINSTVAMMQEFYSVDEFLPFMKNLKEM